MSESDFIRYVGDPDLHDGRIVRVRHENDGLLMRAAHAILRGEPTERSEVIAVSPGQFKLRSSYLHGETGEPVINVVTFTRTQVEELESAP